METSHSAPHGVYEAVHGPDPYTPEEFARDYGVPLEAVREALDYVANNLPLAWIPMQKKKPDRHGFWGDAVFAGFHEAPRFRCRSRNSLWPSKLSAPIFRQPTSVQQSLLPFPRP